MSEETTTKEREEPGTAIPSHMVDGTVASSNVISTQEPQEEEAEPEEEIPVPTPQKRFIPNWSNIISCILFLILIGEHIIPLVWPILDNYMHPKATVTIFAAHQQQKYTYTFLAVTGTPDRSQNQVPSRLISFTTPTRSVTIPTTGIAYTPAVQATGSVTFYNEAPYQQTIAAGTVLTGTDGVQIVTDQLAVLPAGNAPALGVTTVPAHALIGGTKGNIQALDVNGLCCLGGIVVKNTAAFTGGIDPQSYPTVSKADVATATQELAVTLDPLANNGLKSQIEAVERPLQSMKCEYTASSTPKVGERATTAIVSVSEQCQSQVYDYATVQMQTLLLFSQDAGKHTGNNFILTGSPTITLTKVTLLDKSHSTYKVAVSASGTMIFHLSEPALHSLVTEIAGERITVAQHQLLAIAGIQGVYIKPAQAHDTTLPDDPSKIQIVLS